MSKGNYFLLKKTKKHIWLSLNFKWVVQKCLNLTFKVNVTVVQSNLAIRNGLIRNKLVLRNHFLWPICHLLHKDKELLALRNNFRATKKFLIAKFVVQKVYEWSKCPISIFGKITAWSLIYFLNYSLLSYLSQSQILVVSLYFSFGLKLFSREDLRKPNTFFFLD